MIHSTLDMKKVTLSNMAEDSCRKTWKSPTKPTRTDTDKANNSNAPFCDLTRTCIELTQDPLEHGHGFCSLCQPLPHFFDVRCRPGSPSGARAESEDMIMDHRDPICPTQIHRQV
mmetsp:Transcript_53348/g.122054  ORF Transcript_53348/g.122054 Transcript_53348/m.122054 type:complete len:115 (-) Transcript_53348:189-533(-)